MRTKKQHSELLAPLTSRELQILELLQDGLSNAEIAEQLVLTRDTVKWYLQQVYGKLGVGSRTQALAHARALQLLPTTKPMTDNVALRPTYCLPAQVLPLVGRDADLLLLQQLLTVSNVRLVSLIGSGGIGKTHLATELGRRLLDHFADGVFLVSLETLHSFDQILVRVADTIGYQSSGPRLLKPAFFRYLRDKQMLLILDNFEHILDGADLVSDLLKHTVQVQIVVTSREKLNILGETVFALEGLAFPKTSIAEQVPDYSAVRLFCECARRTVPSFRPKDDEWIAIGRICMLVEGMPLALLLAANWVNTLSLIDIAQAIEHALDFLISNTRDLPARQRSIRAVFTSTLSRLTNSEQAAFAQFSVFQGHCSRQAAQAVTGTSLSTLAKLVHYGLVRKSTSSGEYEVHELLRQYGQEQLEATGQWVAARDAHAEYYLDFLRSRVDDLQGKGQRTALQEIEADFDNIRTAWMWMLERENMVAMAGTAEGLRLFLELRTHLSEPVILLYRSALSFLETYSDRFTTEQSIRDVVNLYEGLGNALQLTGAYEEAQKAYEEALRALLPDHRMARARLYRKQGVVQEAQRHGQEALRLQTLAEDLLGSTPFDQADRAWWQEWIAIQIGNITASYFAGTSGSMIQRIENVRAVVEKYGRPDQRVDFYGSIGMTYLKRDRLLPSDETLEVHRRRLEFALDYGDPNKIGYGYFNLGFTQLWRDEFDAAEEQLRMGLVIALQLGNLLLETMCRTYLAIVTRKRGSVDETLQRALQAQETAASVDIPIYGAIAQGNLAWVAWRQEKVTAANDQAQHAFTVLQSIQSFSFLWVASSPLLGLAVKESRFADALVQTELLLEPERQPLPMELSGALRNALQAEEEGERALVKVHLSRACELSRSGGYL